MSDKDLNLFGADLKFGKLTKINTPNGYEYLGTTYDNIDVYTDGIWYYKKRYKKIYNRLSKFNGGYDYVSKEFDGMEKLDHNILDDITV